MSLNVISVVGRLGFDPDFKVTASGLSVCSLRIAVNRTKQGETDWFRVECWRQTAEFCRDYLTKGREVSVSGRMENKQYDDRDNPGKKKDSWQIVAHDIQFVGPKPAEGEGRAQEPDSGHFTEPVPARRAAAAPAADDWDDEIPF
jgi:single-strand DNA-binding protein